LNPPRKELYARIMNGPKSILQTGWFVKSNGLLSKGVPAHSSALGAHGYRRVVEYLKAYVIWKVQSNKPGWMCGIMRNVN